MKVRSTHMTELSGLRAVFIKTDGHVKVAIINE
jgi:hypothetical protein